MRVCVVSHLFPGKRLPMSGIYVKEELDALSKLVGIRLIAPLPNHLWFEESHRLKMQAGYPVVRPFVLAFPRWFMQHRYPPSMALSLRRVKYMLKGCGCLHVHTAFPDVVAAVKAFGTGIPVVATVHGSDLNYFAQKRRLQPDIIASLNRCSQIICVSSALERTARDLGVTTEMTVIPNGIDTTLFTPGEKEVACRRLGIDTGRLRILYAGNFVTVKGVPYLIRAFPQVLQKHPDCELVLVGAEPGKTDATPYETDLDKTGVRGSLRVVERVSRDVLTEWIRASDVVAVPSIREGFGLIAVEALACGRPVVSTRSGGPQDIVVEGQGLLVAPEDADAFGDALLQVLDGEGIHSPDTLAESARERFSYVSIAHRIKGVYDDVCGKS